MYLCKAFKGEWNSSEKLLGLGEGSQSCVKLGASHTFIMCLF